MSPSGDAAPDDSVVRNSRRTHRPVHRSGLIHFTGNVSPFRFSDFRSSLFDLRNAIVEQ
jgi:hypothetical protein